MQNPLSKFQKMFHIYLWLLEAKRWSQVFLGHPVLLRRLKTRRPKMACINCKILNIECNNSQTEQINLQLNSLGRLMGLPQLSEKIFHTLQGDVTSSIYGELGLSDYPLWFI